jgi:hypothetical protein
VGSEAESDPSFVRDAPCGLVFLPGDREIVGSEAESEPSLARDAPSGLVLLPGDGHAAGSEAEPKTWRTVGSEAEPEQGVMGETTNEQAL